MTEAGLRERKKQRTRCALIDSAFALFQRKGFEATTVDEIAEAVDVSARTFFRYFTSKEEVALSLVDEQLEAFFALLAERPAGEPVLTAVRHAAVEVIRECENGESGFDLARYQCTELLLASTPALVAHSVEQASARLGDLAELIGLRMGVDHRTDPRPQLVASLVISVVQTVVNAWREAEPNTRKSELVDRAFALLAEGVNYPSALAD